MSVTDSIVSELKTASNVTNLVSTRIYQDYAYVKAAKPFVVVSRVSSQRHPHFSASSGLVNSRVQVDCVASTRASRDATGEAVREALYTQTGSIGSTSASNDITVQNIDLQDDRHETTTPDVGPGRSGQHGTFTRSMDFMVWHTESVP